MSQQTDASPALDRDQVIAELDRYVRDTFLDGDEDEGLTPQSPLLEWGVLNSMNTALLMTHVREHYGVLVPPTHITASNFRDLESIAGMVVGLSESA